MISLSEEKTSFTQINQQLHKNSLAFINKLETLKLEFELKTNIDLQSSGFNPDSFYYVKSGNVGVEHNDNEIFLLETGDIFVSLSAEIFEQTNINYSTKYEAEIEYCPLDKLYQLISNDSDLISRLFTIQSLSQLQLQQMLATLTKVEERAAPGFKRFNEGDVIIREGDDADYVYSVNSGTAEVTHNGALVGEIVNDEIFGAIAVLTDQKRTATVTAKTSCTVLMVHKDEFQKIAHSHPHIFINVLQSLASNIKALNKKVSLLSKDKANN